MSTDNGSPRRRREPGDRNRNIYRRYDDRFEVGYRDSTGRQRWTRPFDTITAARAARDDLLGRKARGDQLRPNPRLRFGEAADRWLAEQVAELRPATQDIYANAIENHLRPRWGRRRLDTIDVDDVATVVRELRSAGLSERTIGGIVQVAGRVSSSRPGAWTGAASTRSRSSKRANGPGPQLANAASTGAPNSPKPSPPRATHGERCSRSPALPVPANPNSSACNGKTWTSPTPKPRRSRSAISSTVAGAGSRSRPRRQLARWICPGRSRSCC